MNIIYIIILAIAIDLFLGDPPNAVHPVAWMGHVISFLIKWGRGRSQAFQVFWGTLTVLLTLGIFVTPVYFLLAYLRDLNTAAYVAVGALLFKSSFSLRGLRQAAVKVQQLLNSGKLDEARFELRALVGRDTRQLDRSQMVSAAVESVAENSCDSFFAPLLFGAVLGPAGAVGYRVVNTLDNMIGHHGEYEYLGKVAARLDTIVNWIPARITALMIILAAALCRAEAGRAWRIMRRDARTTESPNAGWTMSAMAGALGVQLEKVGYYKLGDMTNPLTAESTRTSIRIMTIGSLAWGLLIIAAEVIYYAAT
jgi:adenosylcobinamide-phosphate synthase